jgi:biotin transport system substrate-specific component
MIRRAMNLRETIRTDDEAGRRLSLDGVAGQALQLACANVLLVLCAKIAIPLPGTPVPLTLQTFGVLVVAVLFGARTSALACALYLVEGAAGLPVFQPLGAPAALRLFGPTAGYLLSFPLAAFVTGRLVELLSARGTETTHASGNLVTRSLSGWIAVGAALIPGQAIILLCGWAWLALLVGAVPAFTQGVLPFLAGDLLKLAAVAAIARSVRVKV